MPIHLTGEPVTESSLPFCPNLIRKDGTMHIPTVWNRLESKTILKG